MHLRPLLLSLTAYFSLNLLTACQQTTIAQPNNPNRFDPATWSSRCQQLKNTLAKEPGINVTYQSRPQKPEIQSSWQLTWSGQRVPIPAIQYSDVFVSHSTPGNYIVILNGSVNGQTVKVLLNSTPNPAPIDDIFSAIAIGETASLPTPEGQALTNQLFGGAVTTHQLSTQRYHHTLTDLSCKKDRWEKEVPIAIALSLKPTDVHTPDSAYRLDQDYTTYSQTDTKETWIARWSDPRQSADIIYQLPKGQRYGKLGLGVGQSNWQAAPTTPQWVNALETALEKPEKRNWQALSQAMQVAKMSRKSVDTVQKIIDAKSF